MVFMKACIMLDRKSCFFGQKFEIPGPDLALKGLSSNALTSKVLQWQGSIPGNSRQGRPKHEIRNNDKNKNDPMTKTSDFQCVSLGHFVIWCSNLFRNSNFDIRILPEHAFSFRHYIPFQFRHSTQDRSKL